MEERDKGEEGMEGEREVGREEDQVEMEEEEMAGVGVGKAAGVREAVRVGGETVAEEAEERGLGGSEAMGWVAAARGTTREKCHP